MDTKEKIELANKVLGQVGQEDVEVIRQDKGLIERKMTEKIVITPDNRELLMG